MASIKVTSLFLQKVTFPVVTVCNQNPVKVKEIPDDYVDSILKEILERLADEGSYQKGKF